MTTGHQSPIKGYIIDKAGKMKKRPPGNVSAKIRQRKSKKAKVVRRSV